MNAKRLKILVKGRVQGVGFRPTVYRYARERKLAGWVSNTASGVVIEIEGPEKNVRDFVNTLKTSPPPQADITEFSVSEIPPENEKDFQIVRSRSGRVKTQVSPELATCPDCRRELLDPKDRRYRYPFLNCTNCGPRFTIVENIPYDRDKTTMKTFTMCKNCAAEYENPLDRRFHAQPNACPVCGPHVTLIRSPHNLKIADKDEAITETVSLLKQGKIVAVKGLGGFHLACDAANDKTVLTLRRRKYRYDKPFALMARDLETIKNYCEVSGEEEQLLTSPRAPIVLLKRKKNPGAPPISEQVAPHNRHLGFMLPYTPLHLLLLEGDLSVLVMTSGNVCQEPIAFENEEANSRLEPIADYFLMHNRPIHTRCDDSVTRIFPPTGNELILRRSRGYVPSPIQAPFSTNKKILACGGHLNNTFALMNGDEIFLSHHIGDLENLEALGAFEKGIKHLEKLFEIRPDAVAFDLHPEYLSTKYARDYIETSGGDIASFPVQHHHAHIAACLAENGWHGNRAIGAALDGAGYGPDATIWGGEFLLADYASFIRIGHLKKMPLPGGEMAIKEPWRMGAVYLFDAFGSEFANLEIAFSRNLDKKRWSVIKDMIEKKVNCPLTSSMGRLFDAVSAIIGIRKTRINYDGQAAIELEMAIGDNDSSDASYEFEITKKEDIYILDPGKIIAGAVEDLKSDISPGMISLKFHNTVAEMILDFCEKLRAETGINEVALSGGVFQNVYLSIRAFQLLQREGFQVFVHQRTPPGDGSTAFGQAIVAAAQSEQ